MLAASSVRDRTREFASACERAAKTAAARGETQILAGEGPTDALLPGAGGSDGALRAGTNSEFAKMSSRIGHGIHGTSQKLERLAQLAKRGGICDDPAQEIAELSAVIKQDITALNTAIAELQNRAAGCGTPARGANASGGEGRPGGAEHTATVVDTSKSAHGRDEIVQGGMTTRQERVKANRTAQDVLERRHGAAEVLGGAARIRRDGAGADPTRPRGQAAAGGRSRAPRRRWVAGARVRGWGPRGVRGIERFGGRRARRGAGGYGLQRRAAVGAASGGEPAGPVPSARSRRCRTSSRRSRSSGASSSSSRRWSRSRA